MSFKPVPEKVLPLLGCPLMKGSDCNLHVLVIFIRNICSSYRVERICQFYF